MILQKTIEGYVLLRNLYEFNSILKYRYNKLKRYRIASMRHENFVVLNKKPNILVSVFVNIMETQSFIWWTIYNFIKSLFSMEENPTTKSKKQNHVFPARVMPTEFIKLHQQIIVSENEKSEVKEGVLTHVRYRSLLRSQYFTRGSVYKVKDLKKLDNGSHVCWFETEINGDIYGMVFKDCQGINKQQDEFELIYNNEI